MNKKQIIDWSATAGKIVVDKTKLNPFAKQTIKWGIDELAEFLKSEVELSIEKICIDAKFFNIDKVIAVPLTPLMGVVIIAFGEQSQAFIKHLGLQTIPENNYSSYVNDILEKEKQFGILVYKKNI